jgi:phosphatidylserine/phosphatidylglycerophosphate/cardiolipin synthase-like enzyme
MKASRAMTTGGGRYHIYPHAAYYRDVEERIARVGAGGRIILMTMTFRPDEPVIARIVHELCGAARRGVSVKLFFDAHALMIDSYGSVIKFGPLLFKNELPAHPKPPFRAAVETMRRLQDSGAVCEIMNQKQASLAMNPFAGTSHTKLALINDRIYVGGCNLAGSDHIDLMVGWDDRPTADYLAAMCQQIERHTNTKEALDGEDKSLRLDKATSLFIDAGIRGQSTILRHALTLIDEAHEHVFITSQYFPHGVTTACLARAVKRGVKVTLVYNHPGNHPWPLNVLHRSIVAFERMRQPRQLFAGQLPKEHRYVHTKLIATEKAAIIGSHNYIKKGVDFGTAEIALLRRDAAFARRAVKIIEGNISLL